MAFMSSASSSRQRASRPVTPVPSGTIAGVEASVESVRPPSGRADHGQKARSVLVLNHEFPPVGGGASPVTYEIAKAYVQRGHAVSVVTMRYKGLPEVELKEGMKIFRVRCLRRRRHICTVPEMLTFVLSARRFLSRHLRTHFYDVSHAHFIVPSGAIALWAKRAFALPYIVTSHGSDVLGYNQRFRLVYPFLSHPWADILREARAVTSPTMFLAERIQGLNGNVPVITIPNAIDPERFRALAKENRILIVARLIELKGIQDVLEALALLDLDGWTVDIVGDGPYRTALERKVVEHRLAGYVTFHGWIDNDSDRLTDLYGKARVFVSASHCENMSMALLEALAAQCWIVAPDVGGTPEIVGTSSLFEPRNILALKERLATTMRAAARYPAPQLRDECRWNRVVRQYEDLFFQ